MEKFSLRKFETDCRITHHTPINEINKRLVAYQHQMLHPQCFVCGTTKHLVIHHLRYAAAWYGMYGSKSKIAGRRYQHQLLEDLIHEELRPDDVALLCELHHAIIEHYKTQILNEQRTIGLPQEQINNSLYHIVVYGVEMVQERLKNPLGRFFDLNKLKWLVIESILRDSANPYTRLHHHYEWTILATG